MTAKYTDGWSLYVECYRDLFPGKSKPQPISDSVSPAVLDEMLVRIYTDAMQKQMFSTEAVQREVWAVESKTTFVLFATKEAAYAYMASSPASVGGGMEMTRLPVLASSSAPLERK